MVRRSFLGGLFGGLATLVNRFSRPLASTETRPELKKAPEPGQPASEASFGLDQTLHTVWEVDLNTYGSPKPILSIQGLIAYGPRPDPANGILGLHNKVRLLKLHGRPAAVERFLNFNHPPDAYVRIAFATAPDSCWQYVLQDAKLTEHAAIRSKPPYEEKWVDYVDFDVSHFYHSWLGPKPLTSANFDAVFAAEQATITMEDSPAGLLVSPVQVVAEHPNAYRVDFGNIAGPKKIVDTFINRYCKVGSTPILYLTKSKSNETMALRNFVLTTISNLMSANDMVVIQGAQGIASR